MAQKKEEWTLHLGGPTTGPPTVEDIVAMTKALTGRAPSPEAIVLIRKRLKEAQQAHGPENHQKG